MKYLRIVKDIVLIVAVVYLLVFTNFTRYVAVDNVDSSLRQLDMMKKSDAKIKALEDLHKN